MVGSYSTPARRLLRNIEARSTDFQAAGQSLIKARDFLTEVISQNAPGLDRMADASRQVQAYSSGLAGQSDALKEISQLQSQVTTQLRDASGTLRASSEQNEKLLAEYRRTFDGYKSVIDELDKAWVRFSERSSLVCATTTRASRTILRKSSRSPIR